MPCTRVRMYDIVQYFVYGTTELKSQIIIMVLMEIIPSIFCTFFEMMYHLL